MESPGKKRRLTSRARGRRLYFGAMPIFERFAKVIALVGAMGIAIFLALVLHGDGLWRGLAPAMAAGNAVALDHPPAPYDLTQLKVVNEILKTIRDKYVDPKRVKPKEMLLSALNYVQRDVAQVIVLHEESAADGEGPRRHAGEGVPRRQRAGPLGRVARACARCSRSAGRTCAAPRSISARSSTRRATACCTRSIRTRVLLSPEAYKEMNLSTQGQFGGLGIVISIRDQQLTVMNPMPSTPAGARGPQEVRSHHEDQQRVDAQHAPRRRRASICAASPAPRSPCGSTATAPTAGRAPKPFELTREVIQVASVEHKLARRRHRLRAPQAVPGEHVDGSRRGARRT